MPRKRQTTELGTRGVRVANSEGKGRGVFATKSFKEGDTIEIAPTIVIPDKDWSFVSNSDLCDYFFERDEGEAVIALGYASLYNHSFEANADYFVASDRIVITATEDIEKGDEIVIDYGWDSWHYYETGIVDKEEYQKLGALELEDEDN